MQNLFALKYWSEKIQLKKSAGQIDRLASLLAKSTIDLNPHQIQAAIYAFNSPLSRGSILADEVGLGKTIEAGLVIAQLTLEERDRILIIAPATLRTQWQQELDTHFGLKSIVLDSKIHDEQVASTGISPLTQKGIKIVSFHFAYRFHNLISTQAWDLVTIDEAHKLRSVYRGKKSKIAFTLREALKNKPKLLLTATPLQNNLLELYGLVSFIDDKLLGNQYFFKSRFIKNLTDEPTLQNETLLRLREIIVGNQEDGEQTGVLTRTLRSQVQEYVSFTKRHSFTYDFVPSKKEQENIVSDLYILRLNTELASPYYIDILLRTSFGKDQIKRNEKGVSGQTKITTDMLEYLLIPTLDKNIQSKIETEYKKMSVFHDKAMEAKAKNNTSAYESNIQTAEKMLRDLIARTETVIRGKRKDVV